MIRRRQRGSILLYVSVLLVTLGLLFGAMVPLAGTMRSRSTRRSDELRAQLAFEAGLATVRSRALTQTLVVGTPIAVSVDGVTGTVTPSSNSVQLANSLLVTGAMVRNGQTYRYSRVVGKRLPSPFEFAVCTKSTLDFKKNTTLGAAGVGGDAWSTEGDVRFGADANVVNGNLFAKSTITTGAQTTVTGLRYPNQNPPTWPSLSSSAYLSAAQNGSLLGSGLGSVTYLSSTQTSITFGTILSGTYGAQYYGSNLTLKGPLSGRGTVYVNGNLTVNGDVTYANADSLVAIVVKGNVDLTGASKFAGYLYCDGTVTLGKDLTVARGAIVGSNLNEEKALTVVRDDAVRNDTDEAVRLRLPYYWP